MTHSRYSTVAILPHWLIAISIAAMLVSGGMIHYKLLAEDSLFHLYQWHKSLGVVLLFAIALRVFWRLSHRPPSLSTTLPTTTIFNRQQLLAVKAGHIALYGLLLLMPLSGWLLVSSSEVRIPTLVFSVLRWPHLPLVDGWNIALINYCLLYTSPSPRDRG